MMPEPIKKLVAVEFEVEKGEQLEYEVGDKYVYLQDPDTGKCYTPKPGYEVTGEDLAQLFDEVKPIE
jgi:hypothetical protein